MFAIQYVKEMCEEIYSLLFQINVNVSIFVGIQGSFFVDSNSPCKDLLLPHGLNLAETFLYLVGTVLNETCLMFRGRRS